MCAAGKSRQGGAHARYHKPGYKTWYECYKGLADAKPDQLVETYKRVSGTGRGGRGGGGEKGGGGKAVKLGWVEKGEEIEWGVGERVQVREENEVEVIQVRHEKMDTNEGGGVGKPY